MYAFICILLWTGGICVGSIYLHTYIIQYSEKGNKYRSFTSSEKGTLRQRAPRSWRDFLLTYLTQVDPTVRIFILRKSHWCLFCLLLLIKPTSKFNFIRFVEPEVHSFLASKLRIYYNRLESRKLHIRGENRISRRTECNVVYMQVR